MYAIARILDGIEQYVHGVKGYTDDIGCAEIYEEAPKLLNDGEYVVVVCGHCENRIDKGAQYTMLGDGDVLCEECAADIEERRFEQYDDWTKREALA
ncbi:hypothetical protein [Paenibacillus pinihumi]|uniref:hypothetical protein n=1 Tax=Paenibacillus pinihumi TaxID=669462 RepID=UPI0004034571|nr:hypothetical protein [Paenibacillus pinihumi]